MSKLLKKMEMDALKATFGEVRDLVLLSITGIPATAENQMRLSLRKKNIRLHTVKNSLAGRVFKDLGMEALGVHFQGPTTVAWGSTSIADLAKELETFIRKNEKTMKARIAVADGQVVDFQAAKKFPTRLEAIGRVVSLALSPASRIAGQLKGPASRISSQLKTISEKPPEEAAPAPAPA